LFRELDHAMLRRLEKRVLVDLPTKEARQAMFQQFLPPTVIQESNGIVLYSDLDYVRLGDVCLLCYLVIF
jgi:katanin p60 ATPase-containing subunit A1